MSLSDASSKKDKLRVLNLEDNPNDSELLQAALEAEWAEVELIRVDSREAFVHALEEFKPDVVLLDYRLPGFDGRAALSILRQSHPDIPGIMVTGALGDIEAVELVKMGAKDYVMKDHLERLTAAVQGALSMERGIRYRKQIEVALRESEARYQAIMSSASDAIVCVKPDGGIYLWNRKAEEMFGYTAADVMGRNLHNLLAPEDYRRLAAEAMQKFAQTGDGPVVGTTVQLTALRKDGSEFPVELSVSAMRIHNEPHAIGIIRDITERKEAEAKIKRLNQLYLALSHCNQTIVRGKNEKELYTHICQSVVQYGGFRMAWVGLIDPDTRMIVPVASFGDGAEAYLRDIKISVDADSVYGRGPTGSAMRDNKPYWCQDFLGAQHTAPWHERGAVLGMRSSASLPLLRGGAVIGAFTLYSGELNAFDEAARHLLIEMSSDINYALDNFDHEAQRLQAEASLRKLSVAVEQNPGSIVITDLDANIEYVNDAFVRVTGYSREEVLGKNPRILQSGKNAPEIYQDMWTHLVRGEVWQGEFVNRRKDGSEYVESVLTAPVRDSNGRPSHYLAVKMDITGRKQAEAKLIHDAKRFEGLLKINEMGGLLPEQEFLRLGLDWVEKLTGSKVAFIHFVNDDQETIELVTWSTATAAQYCTSAFDNHYPVSQAGVWADCLRQNRPVVFNDYANFAGKHGLPEGHSALTRLISVPVVEENKVRVILGVGNKESDYTDDDIEVAQLYGNDMWRIIRRLRVEAELAANLERTTCLNKELQQANTELKATQQQLLQSEKMASIGLLAAGVAHEINNPVGYVNSNLGTLEKYLADIFVVLDKYESIEAQLGDGSPVLEELRQLKSKVDIAYIREDLKALVAESHQGLERVKKIILDLKDFSHADSEDHWMWADVHQGLESTLNVVWNELKYKCEVVKEYGTLPKIYCLPSQLNQVFMNLLVNAAQAIEVRGKIIIRTGHERGRIWIEVTDTGKGIPPENIPHLFDPFFTTKPVGKGTGLGLAVSYRIMEKHHGNIEVQSEVGSGSTFRVWLPVQQPDTKEMT